MDAPAMPKYYNNPILRAVYTLKRDATLQNDMKIIMV